MSHRVVIAGGGTGGHLFPGIAIAEALREKESGVEILFISAGTAMEIKELKEAKLEEFTLTMEKLHRYPTWRLLLVPFLLWGAIHRCCELLSKFQPQVVVAMGGYVAGPMGLAAVRLGIPLVLCEQNCYPGLSNRKLANRAKLVLSAFAGARSHFPSTVPFAVIGNPVRTSVRRNLSKLQARQLLGLDGKMTTLVSIGGSGGSKVLTQGLLEMLQGWQGLKFKLQVLAQCRPEELPRVQQDLAKLSPYYHANSFIGDMGAVYAAADLAILRAGAGMFEALGRGLPLILVPYPYAAADHQMANAREVESGGAAVIIAEGENLGERLRMQVVLLLEDSKSLLQMGKAGRSMGHWGAASAAAEAIIQVSGGQLPDCMELERKVIA